MRALVTGAAGFIGSSVTDHLLAAGHGVVGVDSFTDYYDPKQKWRNLEAARDAAHFTLLEIDLAESAPPKIVEDIDVVFHLAGQPGVRASWGQEFPDYVARNVIATQNLLEAFRDHPLQRFVNSSSSSVYGDATRFPTAETDLPNPVSPYGVTKLAAEHLCTLYGTNFGLPTISLRYFSVFGPRQRPDMAMWRLVESTITGEPFPLYGDGLQVRDFTYVDDVVQANILAAGSEVAPGTVMNIGGGSMTSLASVITTVEELTGRVVPIERMGPSIGDARTTGADTSTARSALRWRPQFSVDRGLERQIAWHLGMHHSVTSRPR